jgi:hypothetical protein
MKLRATIPEDPNEPIKAGLVEWVGVIVVGFYFLCVLVCTSLKGFFLGNGDLTED